MLYFAYGSNLSKEAMLRRAPGSKPIVSAILAKYRLTFESNEPAGAPEAYFANVRPAGGAAVLGAVYDIGERDLAALDVYEDVERGVYVRSRLTVIRKDASLAMAVVYHMPVGRQRQRRGKPSPEQLAQIRQGYADWDLDLGFLEVALRR